MKGWENNVVSYEKEENTGVCPECGSEDIVVEEYMNGRRRSLTFLCKNCNSWEHFDGFISDDK